MQAAKTASAPRDPEFGRRFTETCDANPNVPPPNFGRLGWIKEQFEKRFKDEVSVESVRKWLAGEVKPKPQRIVRLAQLLDVDEGWLAFGAVPNQQPRERRRADSETDGAVLAVAGLIKMAGGHPAFPTEEDARAKKEKIDFYAIIRGAQYSIHVSKGMPEGNAYKFSVPAPYELVMQIGVIQLSDFAVRLIEIPVEIIETIGHRRGPTIDVTITEEQVAQFEIKSLRERL